MKGPQPHAKALTAWRALTVNGEGMSGTKVVAVRLPRETVGELRAIAKSAGRPLSDIVRQRLEAAAAPAPTPTEFPPTPRPGEAAYLPCDKCGHPITVTREEAADLLRRGEGVRHPEDCVRGTVVLPAPSNGKRGWWRRG